MSDVRWSEVWADSTNGSLYLLMVQELTDGTIRVTDPQKSREIVETFETYDAARAWLNEDEYDLVSGRAEAIGSSGSGRLTVTRPASSAA